MSKYYFPLSVPHMWNVKKENSEKRLCAAKLVIDLRPVIVVDGRGRIEKRCEHISFDIADFARMPVQRVEDILDMRRGDFEQSALYGCARILVARDTDMRAGRAQRFKNELHDLVHALPTVLLNKAIIFDVALDQTAINFNPINPILPARPVP